MMDEPRTIEGDPTTADLAKNGAPKPLAGPRLVKFDGSEAVDRAIEGSESLLAQGRFTYVSVMEGFMSGGEANRQRVLSLLNAERVQILEQYG